MLLQVHRLNAFYGKSHVISDASSSGGETQPSKHAVPAFIAHAALEGTAGAAASAEDYHWPDKIPAAASALMQPPPLSPTGQVVPGFPHGAPATSPEFFKFSPEQVAKLKAGHHTAGIVMQTMDAGWPMLQVRGITETLAKFGIAVVATTNAKFQPGKPL